MKTVFTARKLWDGRQLLDDPMVMVEDGCIAAIAASNAADTPEGARLQAFPEAILSAAFFDVHIHGAAGHDVMEATPGALTAIGSFLASRGTAAYLATTVTAPVDKTLRSLAGLAKLIANKPSDGMAWPIGIHLEGPFLSHAKRGVHPPELLLDPDINLFDRMFEAAEGNIRLMTLAPELPGAAEFAAHAVAKGVRVSVGHSDATLAQTRAVIAAGATSATHTYNAMRALNHQEPGILGAALTTDALYAELICDGIHNTPEMVKLWWRSKGPERALLITDAMSATGMPDGTYQLGGFDVEVAKGRAMARGVLAGSVLTLDRALSNFVAFTGATVADGLRLMTANPTAMTGFQDRAGSLTVGSAANLVAVDTAGRLLASIHNGEVVNT